MDDPKDNIQDQNQVQEQDSNQSSHDDCEAKCKELESRYLRAVADYQNLLKRVEEEKEDISNYMSANLIKKILPILDDIEEAAKHLKGEGVDKIALKFRQILHDMDIKEIDADLMAFDPKYHEALDTAEGKEDGKVIKIYRKGYKLKEKVVRPSLVSVSKKKVN